MRYVFGKVQWVFCVLLIATLILPQPGYGGDPPDGSSPTQGQGTGNGNTPEGSGGGTPTGGTNSGESGGSGTGPASGLPRFGDIPQIPQSAAGQEAIERIEADRKRRRRLGCGVIFGVLALAGVGTWIGSRYFTPDPPVMDPDSPETHSNNMADLWIRNLHDDAFQGFKDLIDSKGPAKKFRRERYYKMLRNQMQEAGYARYEVFVANGEKELKDLVKESEPDKNGWKKVTKYYEQGADMIGYFPPDRNGKEQHEVSIRFVLRRTNVQEVNVKTGATRDATDTPWRIHSFQVSPSWVEPGTSMEKYMMKE